MTGKIFSSVIGFAVVTGLAVTPTVLNPQAAAAGTPERRVVAATPGVNPAGYADQLIRAWGEATATPPAATPPTR